MSQPTLIATPRELEDFCAQARKSDFIAVDTEYLQDRHYYSRLCLIQVATEESAVAIDPLAFGLDGWPRFRPEDEDSTAVSPAPELEPFWAVLRDPKVTKVLHAGSNDLEIFYRMTGELPAPLFDTQIGAMACGYSEQISYQKLVEGVCKKQLSKSSRLYHWDKRPIETRQLLYALDDVIYLREIYVKLREEIEQSGRAAWLEEELSKMTDPSQYAKSPDQAWKHFRSKEVDEHNFGMVRELAAWRETMAQRKNLPRRYVLSDIDLLRLASRPPQKLLQEGAFPADINMSKQLKADLIQMLKKLPPQGPKFEMPAAPPQQSLHAQTHVLIDLLGMFLSLRAAEEGVAERLIASKDDLKQLALRGEAAETPVLEGWRAELFGRDALRLIAGKVALAVVPVEPTRKNKGLLYRVKLVDMP